MQLKILPNWRRRGSTNGASFFLDCFMQTWLAISLALFVVIIALQFWHAA